MRYAFRLSLVAWLGIVLVLGGARPAGATDSVDHRSENGGYSVRFPVKPATSVQTLETAAGKIDMHMALAEHVGKGYAVIHAKFPEGFEQVPVETILEGAKQGIEGRGITIHSSKKITFHGQPCLELRGKDANGNHVRARLFMVKTTMYQILVMSRAEKDLDDDQAKGFIASFQLLNKPGQK